MHLADDFIQSDLHCIQVTVLHFFYQLLLSLGIEPMILALLAPCSTIWATGKPYYYQCWKKLCCSIFCGNQDSSMNKMKKYLFEKETFYNIINVFTVTLGQFNMSLLNKMNWNIKNSFKKKKNTDPKLLNLSLNKGKITILTGKIPGRIFDIRMSTVDMNKNFQRMGGGEKPGK